MANVCVITGGGSGMGLAAAKFQPKEKIIVIAGRSLEKLESALAELKALGYTVCLKTCDVSNRDSVRELVEFACSLGTVKNVIHAAGISASMGTPEMLLRINALGTMYVNQEFSKVMEKGAILNVASAAAYTLQPYNVPLKIYKLAETDETLFLQKLLKKIESQKDENQKKRLAYVFSKSFVIWYAQACAFEYAAKGLRFTSISPSLVATEMGSFENKENPNIMLTAAERMGTPEEMGYALATLADERNGHFAGLDVVCDGGAMNGKAFKKKK